MGAEGAHRVWQPREERASAMGRYRLDALETHDRQRERRIACLLAGAVAQCGVGGQRMALPEFSELPPFLGSRIPLPIPVSD